MERFKKQFIEEAYDFVGQIEEALLSLEKEIGGDNKEEISEIFRFMHSLKGTGAMFGFDNISTLTHYLETLYDMVRGNKMKISQELIDTTFRSADLIKTLLEENNNEQEKEENDQLNKHILKMIRDNSSDKSPDITVQDAEKEKADKSEKTFYIFFEPNEKIFDNGTNPLYLLDELYNLGKCKIFPRFNKVPDFSGLEVDKCYLYWDIIIATYEDINSITDVFVFVEDESNLEIVELADGNLFDDKKFAELIRSNKYKKDNIELDKLREFILNMGAPRYVIDETDTCKENPHVIEVKKLGENNEIPVTDKNPKENTSSTLKVSSAKLDHLMNLVSELITTQARLFLFAERSKDSELIAISESMEKLSRLLRDNAFDMSLIPILNLHTRFKRLVRDLSNTLSKKVDFITEGAETELDKNIIENLTDPIMHIIRNSIDHGIETPEQRIKSNKAETGVILLKAYYSGANVHICIQDDGIGIDPDKLRKKGIQNSLISEHKKYSKKQLLDLLFLPGFSTSKKVSNISGRGVGMDVVKQKVEELRGEVEIESELGKGTKITLKIPLTLSIVDGLLSTINNTHFIIPMMVINKIYETNDEILKKSFNNILVFDGEQIPFINLRNEFYVPGTSSPAKKNVIVVNYEDKKMGLVVDTIIGEHQAVLKPLGKYLKNRDMFSGASIMGDGTVALVMDTNKVVGKFINN